MNYVYKVTLSHIFGVIINESLKTQHRHC